MNKSLYSLETIHCIYHLIIMNSLNYLLLLNKHECIQQPSRLRKLHEFRQLLSFINHVFLKKQQVIFVNHVKVSHD